MAQEPRPLTPAQALEGRALWAEAHPEGPCAGAFPLEAMRAAEECWGVEQDGRLVALAAARRWGRVAQVHGLAVAPEHRGRGLGGRLLAAVTTSLVRSDAAVIGGEISGDPRLLAFVARHGFKPMQLTYALERPVASSAPRGLDPLARVVVAPAAELADRERIAHLAASLDADLDPSRWIERLIAGSRADLLLLEPSGADGQDAPLAGLAVLPRDGSPAETLVASMLLLDEGPPFPGLARLAAALDALAAGRGLARVAIVTPSRYFEPLRALLALGFRPRDPALRVTLMGHPERADVLRPCLASWR